MGESGFTACSRVAESGRGATVGSFDGPEQSSGYIGARSAYAVGNQFEGYGAGLEKQHDAEYFFLKAARLNPGYWEGWMRVAAREVAQHRFGPVFDYAITRVMTVAPWERAVHGFVMDLLLPNWYRLTADMQRQLVHYVGNAFAINPGKTRTLIKKYQRQSVLCARSDVLTADRLCLGYGAVSKGVGNL